MIDGILFTFITAVIGVAILTAVVSLFCNFRQ